MVAPPTWGPPLASETCFGGCCCLRGGSGSFRKPAQAATILAESKESPGRSTSPKAAGRGAAEEGGRRPAPEEGHGNQLRKTKWVAAVACASLLAAAVGAPPASVVWAGGASKAVLGIVPLLASLAVATAAILVNKTPSSADTTAPPVADRYLECLDDQPLRGAGSSAPDCDPYADMDAEEIKVAKWHQQRHRQAELALPALEEALRQRRPEDPDGFLNSKQTLLRYLRACNASPTLPPVMHAQAAMARLQKTLAWRQEVLLKGDSLHRCKAGADDERYVFSCHCCRADPMAHCYFPLGLDRRQRLVFYSSAARAAKKDMSGIPHIICELEANLGERSSLGAQQMVWIVDFRGFSARNTAPHVGIEAIKIFGTHYPERLGEIVLLGFPVAFNLLYQLLNPILDPVTRQKVRILRTPRDREAYVKKLWPDWMRSWLDAADELPPTAGVVLPPLPSQSGDPRASTFSRARTA